MTGSTRNRRPSAVDLVIDSIVAMIRDGELTAGDKLPNESRIAEANGVSRGSVREAVRMLVSSGIVTVRHGAGSFVSPPGELPYFDPLLFQLLLDQPTRAELRELRVVVETGLLRLVLENAADEDLNCLSVSCDELEAAAHAGASPDELAALDRRFHELVGQATHNRLVGRLYEFVMQLYLPSIAGAYEERRFARAGAGYHRELLDAIDARDLEAATAAVRRGVEAWGRWKSDG